MRVNQSVVSKLINKAKKNQEFIHELMEKCRQEKRSREEIGEYIFNLNEENHFIDSVEAVQRKLKSERNISVKQKKIANIMKRDLNMSYRKIQTVTVRTNSEKNLVIRQQFALKLIEVLQSGKRVINVDQTWLGMSDFRRMKWSPKD